MKKLVAALLTLVLLLTLAACAKRTADTTEPPTEETTAPTEETTVPTEESTAPTEETTTAATTETATEETSETTEAATTEAPTEETTAPTEAATDPTEPVTETEPPASTSEEELPQLYRDIITSKRGELAAMGTGVLHTLLFDVDADGTGELFLMYPSQEDGKNTYGFDLYTIRNNESVTITQNHTVFYAIAGGQGGSVGVAQIEGRTYVYVHNTYGDWMTYEEEVRLMEIGGWTLYSLKENELLLEAEVSHTLVNGYEDGFPLPGKPYSAEPSNYIPEVSTVTMNGQPMTLEEYRDWLNSMTILQDIDGYSDVASPE